MKEPPPNATSILARRVPPGCPPPSADSSQDESKSGVGKPAVTSRCTGSPTSPLMTTSRSRRAIGWCRQWYASASTRRRDAAKRASARASSALEVSGFSMSTCFPALRAAAAHSKCRPLISGM
eukprot:scaffold4235_cov114-Isochrysis_galbana.AAC.11